MPKNKKVLIVDDSEVNLILVKSVFENDPEAEVFIESNSKKGMQKIRDLKPDVLVLDLMMPELDGFKILDTMKNDVELQHIPVLVISAKYDGETIKRVKGYGAVDYIKKPILLDQVEYKIKNLLAKEV